VTTSKVDGEEVAEVRARSGSSPHVTVLKAKGSLFNDDFAAIWEYRELIFFMVWRDLTTRYKQTALGIGWAVLQPVVTLAIFSLIFGRVAKVQTGDIPYVVFALAGLVPWTYFSQAVSRTGQGLIKDSNLISKVYFPRLIIPLAGAITPLVDFLVAFALLVAMLVWFGIVPTTAIVALPLFILMAFAATMGFGLWFAALNVRYRDVQHIIPFFVQIGLFLSPVAYPASLIPHEWQMLYALNPMVCVIQGFRWCLLGEMAPTAEMIGMGLLTVLIFLPSGLLYFKTTERTFADVI
jgi:lipopolysaccharide transport system permease protein